MSERATAAAARPGEHELHDHDQQRDGEATEGHLGQHRVDVCALRLGDQWDRRRRGRELALDEGRRWWSSSALGPSWSPRPARRRSAAPGRWCRSAGRRAGPCAAAVAGAAVTATVGAGVTTGAVGGAVGAGVAGGWVAGGTVGGAVGGAVEATVGAVTAGAALAGLPAAHHERTMTIWPPPGALGGPRVAGAASRHAASLAGAAPAPGTPSPL